MKAMLTGHRVVNDGCIDWMELLIRSFIVELDGQEDLTIISGGNLGTPDRPTGADRMWALAALREKVPYQLVIPNDYGKHYYGANPDMMARWCSMITNAAEVHVIGQAPFHWRNNFLRNTAMIDMSDRFVVCSTVEPSQLLQATRGGTAHAVKKMKERGVKTVEWIHADGSGITRDSPLG